MYGLDDIESAENMRQLNQTILKYHQDFLDFWSLISETFFRSSDLVANRLKQTSFKNSDEIRKIIIENFENEYTKLFTTERFASLCNTINVDNAIIHRNLKSIIGRYFKFFGLPDKEDMDDLIAEVNDLRREVIFLKKEMDIIKNESSE